MPGKEDHVRIRVELVSALRARCCRKSSLQPHADPQEGHNGIDQEGFGIKHKKLCTMSGRSGVGEDDE